VANLETEYNGSFEKPMRTGLTFHDRQCPASTDGAGRDFILLRDHHDKIPFIMSDAPQCMIADLPSGFSRILL
jgi:hypothetical protein